MALILKFYESFEALEYSYEKSILLLLDWTFPVKWVKYSNGISRN